MRTLCKKALAFCLVAALALTCFVGTFSVSAAEFGATITVAPVTVEQGETAVPVVLAVDSAAAGINEALIKVSSTVGTIDAEATLVKDAAGTAYTEDELNALDYSIKYTQDVTDYGSFYLSGKTFDLTTTSVFIKVVFTVAADKAAGDYAVAIDIPTDKVIAASGNEDVIKFTYEEAKITIVLPHVHNVIWTPDTENAGYHTSSCNAEGCPGFTPATEPCADENEDGACDKCGYVMEVAPETFTVTFVGADGAVLKTEEVEAGAAATAPEVADDLANEKYFTGWDKDFSAITEDTTVNAEYIELLFRIRSRRLKLEDAIRYCLSIQAEKGSFTDAAVKEFGILVWNNGQTERTYATADEVIAADENTPYTPSTNRYELPIDKMSNQMAQEFVAQAYAVLDNGTIVYGRQKGENSYHNASIKNYAEGQINGDAVPNMKKLLTALLVYGAKAQLAFSPSDPVLADAGLTAEQKSDIEAQVAQLNADYGYQEPDTNMTLPDERTSRIRTASLKLESNTVITYGADLSTDPNVSQISEVYILTWSEDAYNAITSVDKNGLVYGTETGCELTTLTGGRYYATSYALKSNEVFDDVYARAYVKYADGSVGYTSIIKYSVEYYCQNGISSTSASHTPALKTLYNALMVYGEYAIINFG